MAAIKAVKFAMIFVVRLFLNESFEEHAVENVTEAQEEETVVTEDEETKKKIRKIKMIYEHIETQFETYSDIDTYLRLENL